ncbi:hypothetical protein V5F44_13365 [Xanthobacter sp. V2C-8]|uniref:hypothetical protein n=1 Tax=Xanthobacter albus TaxID=3119929 RepID=UPI003729DA2D
MMRVAAIAGSGRAARAMRIGGAHVPKPASAKASVGISASRRGAASTLHIEFIGRPPTTRSWVHVVGAIKLADPPPAWP